MDDDEGAVRTARRIVLLFVLALTQVAFGQQSVRSEALAERLVAAAIAQTRSRVTYDGSYRRIPYPGGDVPGTIGVCTDVVIRAYRRVGVDLQVEVHEDMTRAFGSYPQSANIPPSCRGRTTSVARFTCLSSR